MAGQENGTNNEDENMSDDNHQGVEPVDENNTNVVEEYDLLDSQLDNINTALDFLEQKNDDIHAKLRELLQSNIDIREEIKQENTLSVKKA